jgi:hypothetical protein
MDGRISDALGTLLKFQARRGNDMEAVGGLFVAWCILE